MNILLRRISSIAAFLTAVFALPEAVAAPPTSVAITAPANGTNLGALSSPSNSVTITATATPSGGTNFITQVDFRVNGVSVGVATTPSGGFYSVTWTPTAPGTFTLTATATDSSSATNNALTSATATVAVSAVRTASIISPSSNSAFPQDSQIFLRSSTAMSDGVVSKVDFILDPSGANTLIGTATQAPYNVSYSATASVGAHTLLVRATASDGITTFDSPTINLSVVTAVGTRPVVTLTSPAAGSFVATSTAVALTATATDGDGFIPNTAGGGVTFFADGDPIGTDLTSPYSISWTPTVAKTYSLVAQAVDDRENVGQSAPVSVNAVAALPTITVTAPATATTGTPTSITATASASPGATVTQVAFFANGVAIGAPVTTAPYSVTWTPTQVGANSITAQVTDSAGITVTSSTSIVTVSAPTGTAVTLLAPINGATIPQGSQIFLRASASIAGNIVSRVDYYLDGVLIPGGSVSTIPYNVAYTVAAATGPHSFFARAVASDGTTTVDSTTATINVAAAVGAPPTVTLTAPLAGSFVATGSAVTLTATASDSDGFIPASTGGGVTFYVDGDPVGSDLTAPYTFNWTPGPAKPYSLRAQTVDDKGNIVLSAPITVTAVGTLPTVSLTSPPSTGSIGTAVTLTATASASSGATVVQVVFFANGVAIGAPATSEPYSVSWTPSQVGTNTLTAQVTDSNGATAMSSPASVTVASVAAPTVSITSPAIGAVVTAGSPVTVSATATAGAGATVAQVQFLAGTTIIGSDTSAPYAVTWTPPSAGNFNLTARVTDSSGNLTTSSVVAVTAIALPTTAITSPANNASLPVGTAATLTASASPSAGATVAQVEFFADATSLGVVAAAPYSVLWTPAAVGPVVLTTRVTDSAGFTNTSPAISVNVTADSTVSITSPAIGTVVTVGSPVTVSATATAGVGATVAQIQFFAGTTIIGSDTSAPYAVTWTPPSAGNFNLTAKATDSSGNLTTSSVVNVTAIALPTTTITSPTNNANLPVGIRQFNIVANASPSAGATVTQVEFLANDVSLGFSGVAPYTLLWTFSTTGPVDLTTRVTDSAGFTNTSNVVHVNVTGAGPSVTVVAPLSGTSVMAGSNVTITAAPVASSGFTVSQVQFLVNGTAVGSTAFAAPYSTTWIPTTAGVYTVTARVTDSLGNTATSDPVSVTVIPTAGVSLSMAPSGTTVVAGSPRFLTATVASTISVDEVQFFFDGVLIGTSRSAPYTILFNVPDTAGLHNVEAVVIDRSGGSFRSTPINLTVVSGTGTPPTAGILAPNSGAFIPLGTVTPILVTASDPDGTIASVQVFANGVALPGTPSLVNGVWTQNWNPPAAGVFSLSAIVTDNNGNSVAAPAVGVNVTDNSPPNVALALSPGAGAAATNFPTGATRNLFVTATASPGRAVVRVEFFVDGGKIAEDTTVPYNFRYTAPETVGSHLLSVRVTDNAGAVRDVSQLVNVISAVGSPPTATVVTPTNNSTVVPNTALTLAATAIASGGTISSVQFYQNGTVVGNPITNPPYTTTFTPNAPGSYVFDAIATDDRGNTAVSNAVTVSAAFGVPTIAITSPRTDSANTAVRVTPSVPLTISAAATGGTGSTILLVEFLIDGLQVGVRTTPSSGNTTAGTYSFAWTPDPALLGTHVLTTRVTDTNSNTATSAPININVANIVGTPPTLSITAPANNATIQSLSTVNFTANTSASATSVEFFINDASIGLAAREQATNTYRLPYNFGNFNFSALTPIIDPNTGNPRYTLPLYAIAKDSNGNQTVTPTFNLNVVPSLSLPPSVQLVSIGIGGGASVTAGTPFALGAIVSDPDGIVTILQLFANGSTTPLTSVGNPAPNTILQFTPNTAGRFNLYAVVTDDSGNTTVSTPVVLNVTGNTAPTAVLVRPSEEVSQTTVNSPIFLEARASDRDVAQTVSVAFINTNTGQTLATGTRVGTTDVYRAVWSPNQANTFTVGARATDSAGGSTTSSVTRRVIVSNVVGIAPSVTLTRPTSTGGSTGGVPTSATTASTADFSATATDSDGSVVEVEFFLNRNSIGQAVKDPQGNTWRLTASFAGIQPGTAEVVARARDSSGNVAASPTTNISVTAASSIAPSITITPSTTDAPFGRQVQLTANARDTDGTISSVQYFQNATAIASSTNSATNYQVTWTPTVSGTFNIWAVTTDNSGITRVAPTVQVNVRRNNPVLEDAAFISQTYQDIANTSTINPLVFADLDAQLGAGTMTRADLVESLIGQPGFLVPVNLLASYYVLMGQWPTPQNYTTFLATARGGGGLASAINSILNANEYFAKYGYVPTAGLLNNPASVIPARTFLTVLHQNAGLPPPSDLQDLQFRSNNVLSATLGRGYNSVSLTAALAEFVTNTNSNNTALFAKARAAALYYQLDRPPLATTTDEIAARIAELVLLGDTRAIAEAALKDILYTYRYVTITKNPTSLVVSARSGALFSVEALGAPPLAFQWLLNGAPIPGATDSLLSLTNVDATRVGTYTAVVTSNVASSTSDPATLTLTSTPTKLANISTRGVTSADANVLIGGFIVTGNATQTRQILVRVVGPRLGAAPFNVSGFLADPRLELYRGTSQTPIATNDNWGTQAAGTTAAQIQQAANRVGAFALNNNSADAAILVTLQPGPYTVQAKGPNANSSGVVLIEVYDATQGGPAASKVENVSTRGVVGAGNNILIGGFVVNGEASRRLLIRGAGPTLQAFGLPANSLLSNPQLTLVSQESGATIATNDDWASGSDAGIIAAAANAAGAFPLANGSRDAAMLVMLPPGAYTVQLSGVGGATGIGIVEVYDVDP
ncbi:MAG: Ig-like domain-containing protein [Opitutaceae bacterium]|nr:Ig-like domain-containing protein [Opitutaceae bacterium]